MLLSLCLRNPKGSVCLVYFLVAPALKMLDWVKFNIALKKQNQYLYFSLILCWVWITDRSTPSAAVVFLKYAGKLSSRESDFPWNISVVLS